METCGRWSLSQPFSSHLMFELKWFKNGQIIKKKHLAFER